MNLAKRQPPSWSPGRPPWYKRAWGWVARRWRSFWRFTPWQRLKSWHISVRLAKEGDRLRLEAEAAVDRVVWETSIAPDCVSANTVRGGPTILVKHDDSWEAFVHNSYDEAAVKAIEWINLQGGEVSTRRTSKMNRKSRRAFDALRKRRRSR